MFKSDLILVTNDDGYKAKGIKALLGVAKLLSRNVWSFAPNLNNSGKSHSITINKKIKIKPVGDKHFVVFGKPVDSVLSGVKYLKKKKQVPSIILSGINYGQNLGLDLLYSGTAAAAKEGSILGIKSFAISLEKNNNKPNWSLVSKYLPSILENIIKLDINSNIFFNINFPNINFKELKGCKVVKAGKRKPGEISKIIKSKSDNFYLYIPSERKIHKTASSNEDEYELKKKFITVTCHTASQHLQEKMSRKVSFSLRKIVEK